MKKLLTESDIIKYYKDGNKVIPISSNELLTPLAKDKINELGLVVVKKSASAEIEPENEDIIKTTNLNKVVLASDHTGFRAKNMLAKVMTEKGFDVTDVGTYNEESCDYPDFAYAAALKVQEGSVDFGIILDATGIPSAITANKIPGIRAATCYNEFTAKSAREHNNANILVLGAKTLGEETIKSILETWLNTSFGGGRHQKRLNKITEIERKHKI